MVRTAVECVPMADGAQLLPNLCQKAEILPKEVCEEYAGVASHTPSPRNVQELSGPSSHQSNTQGAYDGLSPFKKTVYAAVGTSVLGQVAKKVHDRDWPGLAEVGLLGITRRGVIRPARVSRSSSNATSPRPEPPPSLEDVKTAFGSIRGKVEKYEGLLDFQRIKATDLERFEAFKGYLKLDGKIIGQWVTPAGLILAGHSIKRWLQQEILNPSVAAKLTNAIEAAQKLVEKYRSSLM